MTGLDPVRMPTAVPSPTSDEHCGSCRWFLAGSEGAGYGQCSGAIPSPFLPLIEIKARLRAADGRVSGQTSDEAYQMALIQEADNPSNYLLPTVPRSHLCPHYQPSPLSSFTPPVPSSSSGVGSPGWPSPEPAVNG